MTSERLLESKVARFSASGSTRSRRAAAQQTRAELRGFWELSERQAAGARRGKSGEVEVVAGGTGRLD
jgi:hypothetical protein